MPRIRIKIIRMRIRPEDFAHCNLDQISSTSDDNYLYKSKVVGIQIRIRFSNNKDPQMNSDFYQSLRYFFQSVLPVLLSADFTRVKILPDLVIEVSKN